MIGGMEWIILLLAIVALLFGAKKIPEVARSLGKAKAEFSRGEMQVRREIREEQEQMEADEKRKGTVDVRKAAKALGIDTEGKTDAELKKEIAAKVG